MSYKDDAKASRREKLSHYADGGSVSRSSNAQVFGPENEPGPTDNPRDYGRYPASLGEKITGTAKFYGDLASDFYDKAKKAVK